MGRLVRRPDRHRSRPRSGFDLLPGADDEGVTITTTDQARLLALLLDAIAEPCIDAFVGASYGGCVGLAFAAAFPGRVRELVVISAAHRTHPAATAWRGVQRRLLAFARDCGREAEGIALARELAMTTYRTAEEFGLRFATTSPPTAGQPYPVCDYLIARGADYAGATSGDRWISLSDSLDRHAVDPEAVLCPLTLIGFTSDQLVPIDDIRELAERAPNLRRLIVAPSRLRPRRFPEGTRVGRPRPARRPLSSHLNQTREIAA